MHYALWHTYCNPALDRVRKGDVDFGLAGFYIYQVLATLNAWMNGFHM